MEHSRNGPGSMQTTSRCARVHFFPAHFSVSVNVGIFLPIFRFESTSSRTLEFLIVSGIISCHVISSQFTDAQTVVAYTIKDKRRPGSLREPVLLSWRMYTSACAHFQLSMCMLAGEHTHMYTSACAHFHLSMCTHSGEHVYIYMFIQFSMCTLSVEHVHTFTF